MDIYTDGSCLGNPGPGGWAYKRADGEVGAGNNAQTTNNRMEMTACFQALARSEGSVNIISDSKYVVDCFEKRWYDNWRTRGWMRGSKKKPTAGRQPRALGALCPAGRSEAERRRHGVLSVGQGARR